MSWKILCSLSAYDPQTLAAKLATNVSGATGNYKHAFLITSPKKNIAATEKGVTLWEYSGQKLASQSLPNGLTPGPVAGYVAWNDGLAVVVDEGPQAIDDIVTMYGKAFVEDVAKKGAVAKQYPIDCLGFCVTVVKKAAGLKTVAGHDTGL